MTSFVSIISAYSASELYMLRSRLDFEGIECYIKDELTNQVNPLYSVATGGVELMVRKEHYTSALRVLLECGYEIPKDNSRIELFFAKFHAKTTNIPLIGKLSVHTRFLAMTVSLIVLSLACIYYMLKPDLYETLIEKRWAVRLIDHNGQIYKPKTHGTFIQTAGESIETIDFWPNTRVYLSGINTPAEFGIWFLSGDHMTISGVKELGEIYNGTYEVSVSFRGELTIANEQTVIRCYEQ